jgi:hypothetical protein
MDSDRTKQQLARRQLTLELDSDEAGRTGRLCDELGVEHRFSGWLGLLTLLEAARLRHQHAADRERDYDKEDRSCVLYAQDSSR